MSPTDLRSRGEADEGLPEDFMDSPVGSAYPDPRTTQRSVNRISADELEKLQKKIEKALRATEGWNERAQRRLRNLSLTAAVLGGASFDTISVVVGISGRRLAGLLQGSETVPEKLDRRVRKVQQILQNLHRVLEPSATGRWLETPIPELGGTTPLEMFAHGQLDDLLSVTQSYLDPSFG